MHLPDRVQNVPATLRRMWEEHRLAALRDYADTLGYDDAGHVCAYLRAQGETKLAQYVEGVRFK